MKATFISRISRKSKTNIAGIALIVGILTFGICQGVLFLISMGSIISTEQVSFQLDVLNILIPGVCASLMVYLSVKYSGIPLKSELWKQKFNHIFKVSIYWTVTRIMRGLGTLIGSFFGRGLTINLEDDRETTADYIILIIILIVSEILCVFSVQDYGFMDLFVSAEAESDSNPSTPILAPAEDSDKETIANTSISILQLNESPLIGLSEVTEGEEFKGRKQGLGKLFKSKFKDSDVMFRKITLPRLSGYVIEELTGEIETHRKLQFSNVLPIIAIVIEMPVIGFITPIMPKGSLFEVIHVQKLQMTLTQKLEICEKIADELNNIHSQSKSHGHLTSHNILLDDSFTPFISDFGFSKVKKYAGIVSGYTNISAWSSPELLKDKRLTPIKSFPSDDSYSFGMILWEIIAEQEPFPGYNRKQLVHNIIELGHRPVIHKDTPEDVAEIIMKCWNPDPKQRPDMGTLVSVLDSYNKL
jgi:tRNA A-37 threonylcarbamoyl transferase component Bud32